ncbi:MAG: hypothetical protein WDZ62_01015 [Candidatus Pacearchaeota archaeon]
MIFLKRGNKKGELTTKQLITIIVLITSFIVILFLLFRLNLGETNEKQICHNSVLLQDKSVFSGPLDCRTNYVCISSGKECENIRATVTERIDPNKEEIMNILAEEMSDCWWMFGEGKINYGGKALVERTTEFAICSVVEFDESLQNQISEITYQEFYDYLKTSKKSSSQTYLQYIYSKNTLEEMDGENYVNFSLSDSINTSRKYSIITGIDNRVGTGENFRPDTILKVYIIPTDETSDRLLSPREFITKS